MGNAKAQRGEARWATHGRGTDLNRKGKARKERDGNEDSD
jgi:hypothetical protein